MKWWKLSTATSIRFGPMLSTDGTRLTGLALSTNDIQVSKNGGLLANYGGGAVQSLGLGWYSATLAVADMNTAGPWQMRVINSSGLDLEETGVVFPAVVYNALVVGSAGSLVTSAANMRGTDSALLSANVPTNFDALSIDASGYVTKTLTASNVTNMRGTDNAMLSTATGTNLTAIPWNAAWDAEVESEVDDALGGGTGTALTAIPWNSAWDAEVESEVDDALGGGTGTALVSIPWNSNWDAQVESEVDDALGGGTGTALTSIPWNSNWDAQVQSEVSDALVGFSVGGMWAAIQAVYPKKNTAKNNIVVPMIDETDDISPKTGLTVTVTVSKDGGTFGATTGSIAEIGATGIYQFDASAADMNADEIVFKFAASGANDSYRGFTTRP